MKKSILAMVALLSTSSALAASYNSGIVSSYNIGSDGYVSFGMTVPFSDTCNYFSDQFRFAASNTDLGKMWLQTILAAKATGLTLRVWYNASTQPNTDQNSGCTYNTMATVTGIGLQ